MQVDKLVQNWLIVLGAVPVTVSAFTSTGITAPVFKENTR